MKDLYLYEAGFKASSHPFRQIKVRSHHAKRYHKDKSSLRGEEPLPQAISLPSGAGMGSEQLPVTSRIEIFMRSSSDIQSNEANINETEPERKCINR